MIVRWLEGHIWPLMAVMASVVIVALALIAVLFIQLHQTRTDLERVESGAAFFALQVQSLRAPLMELEPELRRAIDEAIAGLESVRMSPLELAVQFDQSIELDTEFEIVRDLVIPVNTSFPVSQSFDTTVQVQGPLGLTVPVDVTVPIELDIPVEMDLMLPIDERVPIRATVPLHGIGPVTVDISQTGFGASIDALIGALLAVRELLAGIR